MPVCAVAFETLPELLQHDQNGLVFQPGHPEELAEHVVRMFHEGEGEQDAGKGKGKGGRDQGLALRSRLRANVARLGGWDENWGEVMPPFLATIGDQSWGAWATSPKVLIKAVFWAVLAQAALFVRSLLQ